MADPTGRTESVKKRLISLIDSAISGAPYFGTVSGNWKDLPLNFARNLPLVTVRLGPTIQESQVYGMLLQSSDSETVVGKMESWAFTLYCLTSACKEAGESQDRYVHQLTDAVEDYLDSYRFAQDNYEIFDIEDLTKRESNVKELPHNIRRMIIEGTLWVRKTQDAYYNE